MSSPCINAMSALPSCRLTSRSTSSAQNDRPSWAGSKSRSPRALGRLHSEHATRPGQEVSGGRPYHPSARTGVCPARPRWRPPAASPPARRARAAPARPARTPGRGRPGMVPARLTRSPSWRRSCNRHRMDGRLRIVRALPRLRRSAVQAPSTHSTRSPPPDHERRRSHPRHRTPP